MNAPTSRKPVVVVGIDGSKQAMRAAGWAAVEAASRDATLRLVYVIETDEADRQESIDVAQRALSEAWAAVADTQVDVKIESEIASGRPADCLIEESRYATLTCVGHRDGDDRPKVPPGSTAVEVARKAYGSVAIVRRAHPNNEFDHRKWIVVAADESEAVTETLKAAQDEAATRDAPILVLESWSHSRNEADASLPEHAALKRYLKDSTNHHVQSVTLPMPEHLTNLLRQSACIDQLFIVPGDRTDLVDELTDDRTRKLLQDSDCSLMVIR
ncbi:universal stress protein [Mycobacterium sp. OTB74]|jgi:nucleotide-binding universal stress UspA family protein|uniref:universal stress protein n=1 Tax=Mycobacterium sp. OTB74 TaxID=1853452 RepID=UPI002474D566|nr:universal stress protein [Mycobacterium sp. OTB74]MDH6246974.1 nucleotide-binding universal stress UspA family protein [Mycobacterium sp. OTB74]